LVEWYSDGSTVAHEIGHSWGLWPEEEEYDVYEDSRGRIAGGYWVNKRQIRSYVGSICLLKILKVVVRSIGVKNGVLDYWGGGLVS
ncbi:MAG: hypothetical protein JSU80_09235, partial [Deltaproteobacteria bacterium]